MPRIQQIVLNLVSNALKFTERGSVKIRCSIERKENGQDENGINSTCKYLVISVIDSGVGISKEN